MEQLYCFLTGRKPEDMRIKILLRVVLFIVLAGVKSMFGMDWALIVVAVVVVSDLDAIAEAVQKKFQKDC